jgi:protein transport protein DSL1/ZW10
LRLTEYVIQEEISTLSEQSGVDVDSWISQAQQLQADIEQSRAATREIVANNEKSKLLQAKIENAAAKVNSVKTEIAFNSALTVALEQLQEVWQRLDRIRTAVNEGHIASAIRSLEHAESVLEGSTFPRASKPTSIIFEELALLRRSSSEILLIHWNSLVRIDRDKGELEISSQKGETLMLILKFFTTENKF